MPSPARIVRYFWAAATVVSAGLGLIFRDPRFFVASGAFGVMWWAWDLLLAHLFGPVSEMSSQLFGGAVGTQSLPEIRPTLDDTIRLLENRLRDRASRRVEIQAAIRLEEIYRLVKKEPGKAKEVMELARERYPDAEELRRQ